jgi:hypothetical protein
MRNTFRNERVILSAINRGIFTVRKDGTIWRTSEVRNGKMVKCTPRRAEFLSTNGYLRIRTTHNGQRVTASAHRVVYRYLGGTMPGGLVVDHLDGVRTNNRPSNLEAVTHSENVLRAFARRSQ